MVSESIVEAFRRLPSTSKVPLPKRVSVLGLGVTGRQVSLFLAERGCQVVASDRGEPAEEDAELLHQGIQVRRGSNWIGEGDLVVISPGIQPHTPIFREALAKGSDLVSAPELFARFTGLPIVAISGTDGKSTVTTWIDCLLRANGLRSFAGGNLGTPMVQFLREEREMDVAVIEISAFQLLTTSLFSPGIAVMTNVVDDHLDYFQGISTAYRAAKKRLLKLCRPGAQFISAQADPVVSCWEPPTGVTAIEVGSIPTSGIYVSGTSIMMEHEQLVDESELRVRGRHNLLNGAMVATVGSSLGISREGIRRGLLDYVPLPHRSEFLAEKRGVAYINDSKATSPHATLAGISNKGPEVSLLLGGSDKGSDFTGLIEAVKRQGIRVFPFGATGGSLALKFGVDTTYETLDEAMKAAQESTRDGGTVLLSPACASFDQYASFAHRGDHFRRLVESLED